MAVPFATSAHEHRPVLKVDDSVTRQPRLWTTHPITAAFSLPCATPAGATIWPTPGQSVDDDETARPSGVATVVVRYELYQGVPGFGKHLRLQNTCPSTAIALFNLTSVFRTMSDVPPGFGDR